MTKKNNIIPVGSLFTVTNGIYSDYEVIGMFKALKPIDHEALRKEWLVKFPKQSEIHRFEEYKFLAWLSAEGFLADVESWDFYIGDYSNISTMMVFKNEKL